MKWMYKAGIQRVCAGLPQPNKWYSAIQRRFGRLDADPFRRLSHHRAMLSSLERVGQQVTGARCFEVGTGHVPIVPIAFYLAGAEGTTTVDLNRRIEWELTGELIRALAASEERVATMYEGLVDPNLIADRLGALARAARWPAKALEQAGIDYRAPCDAAATALPDATFDIHFSVTVLEHVQPAALGAILGEGRRILKSHAMAAHDVDLSDHFAHEDPTIPLINFLRYGERKWSRLAGNQFAYCNRLRAPQVMELFAQAGFDSVLVQPEIDERSLAAVQKGLPVDPAFSRFSAEELCTTRLSIYARPGPRPPDPLRVR